MSYSYSKRSYSPSAAKSSSPSQVIEDSKKKTSLLKDGSWIRRDAEEDEAVDRDPNFGRVVLNKYRSNEALDSAEPADSKSPKTTTTKTLSSVEALKKRFGGSQDELSKGSTLPSTYGRTSTSYTKSTSPPKSDCLKTTTVSKTTVTEEPKKTSTTTTTIKGGTTTESTISTSQSVSRSPVVKSPTNNSESFTDRVFSSRKRTEDQLVDTLIPTSIKTEYLIPDSTTNVSKTETVTLKTKKDITSGDASKTPPTTPRRASSTTEDDLFGTLLPTSMKARYSSPDGITTVTKKEVVTVDSPKGDVKIVKSPTSTNTTITGSSSYSISSKPSEDYTSTNTLRSYSSKPDNSTTTVTKKEVVTVDGPKGEDYTSTNTLRSYSSKPDNSVSSTTVYTTSTTYKDSSRAEDDRFDSLMSKQTKTVYSTPESPSRTVLERDLCSYCRKPMSSDPKMVLEDMKINCHTTCFKCEVCSSPLGHLKAGDSMWVYRRTVHCERCFEVTREKWHR